jgi:hypothetical protein
MNYAINISMTFIIFASSSCKTSNLNKTTNNQKQIEEIEFIVLKNYFVNKYASYLDNPKIETESKFNETFGMATTMSEDGKPTKIDFNKQFIVAIILPETAISTSIELKSLVKDLSGELTLSYKVIEDKTQSFTSIPFVAIAIGKKEIGNVTLRKIN